MTPLIDDLKDALHRAFARLFPHRVRHNAKARHHHGGHRARGGVGVLASTLTRQMAAERRERTALALLRTECERMATLLDGVRRGHREAVSNATVRAALKRETARTLHRVKAAARVPARTRFAHAGTAVRTAARETAAVAARAARQVGAHRHVGAATREYHDLAAQILARAKAYGASRARGENSIWTTPRGLPA